MNVSATSASAVEKVPIRAPLPAFSITDEDERPMSVGADQVVAVTSAVPPTYPVLVVVIVGVELVAAATPVTVTKPVPLMATVPDAVAVPAHV